MWQVPDKIMLQGESAMCAFPLAYIVICTKLQGVESEELPNLKCVIAIKIIFRKEDYYGNNSSTYNIDSISGIYRVWHGKR